MKRMMRVVACVVIVGVLAGCRKDSAAENVAAGVSSAQTAVTNGQPKSVNEMAPDDVIVSVNGVALTKQQFVDGMNRIKQDILRKEKAPQQSAAWNIAGKMFIPRFIELQLLEQEAKRTGVLKQEVLSQRADALMKKVARGERKSVPELIKTFPGGEAALRRDSEQTVLINAFISNNIPPKVVVDDAFVAQAMAAIKADNDAIAATNRQKVARLTAWRQEILTGKDFDAVAREFSECPRSGIEKSGYWGEFEREDFKDLKMRNTIFEKLQVGELSEVLEDEEAYHLVKILQKVPPKKNEKGRLIKPATLKLAHIMLFKEPPLEMYQPQGLKHDLAQQMQQQAVDEYIEKLRGKATIVYPHGTNFWDGAQAKQGSVKPTK